MVKKSAPILEVSRLLDLVPFLSTHSHISLKELADEFGVSEKEMANELTSLSMCGLPGYTPYELIEIFFDSGFVTINNHDSLDIPRALSNLEVASLLIGLEMLREVLPDSDSRTSQALESLLSQLRTLSSSAIQVSENPEISTHSEIRKAIESRSSIEIEYLSPVKNEVTKRVVTPASIVSENSHLYLSAYCHTSEAFRTFRLDRISLIKPSENHPGRAQINSANSENESASLSVALQLIGNRRSISETLGLVSVPADGRVRVNIYSSEWISKAIIAFSPDLHLLEPVELRQKTRDELKNILALYSS